MQGTPEFSIILPLERDHGLMLPSVRSWTQQDFPGDRFEVICVSRRSEDARLEAVRRELGSQGRVIVEEAAGEIDLFNIGARSARGRFLLLTETHCIGGADSLSKLAEFFSSRPELVGARCPFSMMPGTSRIGALEHRVFLEEDKEWHVEGHWRRVLISGCVIERDLYLRCGGLDPRYGMFSQLVLAAQLHYKGYKLGFAHEVHIDHAYSGDMQETVMLSRLNTPLEIEYRATQDEEFCEQYFGRMLEWSTRGNYRSDLARALASALLQEARRPESSLSKRTLLGQARRLMPRALLGIRPELVQTSLLRRTGYIRMSLLRFWPELGYRAMRDYRRGVYMHDRYRAIRPYLRGGEASKCGEHVEVASYPANRMSGFLPKETWEGEPYRWTAPSAVIEVAVGADVAVVALKHVPLRPPLHDPRIAVYLAGRRLRPIEGCDPGERCFAVEPSDEASAGLQRLAVICDAFVPAQDGVSEDRRRLGMALASIELRRA